MKRYNNIYDKIYDIENLKKAHKNARKDKAFYSEVKLVDENEEKYLLTIQEMLKNETYQVSKYKFSIINDKGKKRELAKLPYFPDRIIQWAIMLQIEPIIMKTFCGHTCASIKNRGIKKASNLTKRYLRDRENTKYCLKIDVKKFYPSINKSILKQLLRKKFKDSKLLRLLDTIIDSYPKEKGLPIGSYLSQYLANFYLTYFDHWLKETKKVKRLVRFMDDMTAYHKSSFILRKLLKDMMEYLSINLGLSIKDNWQIFPTEIRGVDFVGYRFYYDHILLRKSTCKKFKKNALKVTNIDHYTKLNKNLWCSINSYIGWMKWCNSYNLYNKYIENLIPTMINYYRYIVNKNASKETQFNKTLKYEKKLIKMKGRDNAA